MRMLGILKKLKILLCGLLLCLLFTGTASAAEPPVLWVSRTGEYTVDAIYAEKGKDGYTLYLPGYMEKENVRIGITGGKELLLNGEKLENGDSAEKLHAENTLTIGGRETKLTVMQGSPGLPAIYITTDTGNLDRVWHTKNNKEPGDLLLLDGSGETVYDGRLDHLKLRGNGTRSYPKKTYQFKLENGTSLLGMGKAKRWILRGGYIDRSFLREEIGFDMADFVGLAYTPEHTQCELYINHEYHGLYLLMEKIEIDDDRVDIANLEKATEDLNERKPENYSRQGASEPDPGAYKFFNIPNNPEDITGGYILEFEALLDGRYVESESAYQTKRGINIAVKSPEYASKAQMSYISGLIQRMENAIFAQDGRDPATGMHFTEILDLDSFVKKYILNELLKNYDSNSSSEYMYKPEDAKSTKIFAGPVWDLDNCMAGYARDDNAERMKRTDGLFVAGSARAALWWPALYRQEVFLERVKVLYGQVFMPALDVLLGNKKDPSGKLLSLDEYAARIAESAEMNYTKYPELRRNLFNIATGKNLAENVDYIRRFLEARSEYLRQEWSPEAVLDD